MTDRPDTLPDRSADAELDDYLAGRHPLSARYRGASTEQPPPPLDAAILTAARTALPPRRRRPRWQLPLATAATLLLSVGLVSQLRDQALPLAEPVIAALPTAPEFPESTAAAEDALADLAAAPPLPAPAARAAAPLMAPPAPAMPDVARNASAERERRLQDLPAQQKQAMSAPTARRAPASVALAEAHAGSTDAAITPAVVDTAAEQLLHQLRMGDFAALQVQGHSTDRLEAAARTLAHAHTWKTTPHPDGRWQVEYRTPEGEPLGTVYWLEPEGTWQLDTLP